MNIVVLHGDCSVGEAVHQQLIRAGVGRCAQASTVMGAVEAAKRVGAQGVLFDRELIQEYIGFFDQFQSANIWFIPMSVERNDLDIIAALNTHRTAYYLIAPITEEQVSTMLECLEWRMAAS